MYLESDNGDKGVAGASADASAGAGAGAGAGSTAGLYELIGLVSHRGSLSQVLIFLKTFPLKLFTNLYFHKL